MKITIDCIELAKVLRENRFYVQAKGVHAIADYLETKEPNFDRSLFYARVEGCSWQPTTGQPSLVQF